MKFLYVEHHSILSSLSQSKTKEEEEVASQDDRPGPRALQPHWPDGPDEGGLQGDEGRGPVHPGDSHSETGGELN